MNQRRPESVFLLNWRSRAGSSFEGNRESLGLWWLAGLTSTSVMHRSFLLSCYLSTKKKLRFSYCWLDKSVASNSDSFSQLSLETCVLVRAAVEEITVLRNGW